MRYKMIENWYFDIVDGKNAIIASNETPQEFLKKYNFSKLLDGRYCHFLSDDEYKEFLEELIKNAELPFARKSVRSHIEKFCIMLFLLLTICICIAAFWVIASLKICERDCDSCGNECEKTGKIGEFSIYWDWE